MLTTKVHGMAQVVRQRRQVDLSAEEQRNVQRIQATRGIVFRTKFHRAMLGFNEQLKAKMRAGVTNVDELMEIIERREQKLGELAVDKEEEIRRYLFETVLKNNPAKIDMDYDTYRRMTFRERFEWVRMVTEVDVDTVKQLVIVAAASSDSGNNREETQQLYDALFQRDAKAAQKFSEQRVFRERPEVEQPEVGWLSRAWSRVSSWRDKIDQLPFYQRAMLGAASLAAAYCAPLAQPYFEAAAQTSVDIVANAVGATLAADQTGILAAAAAGITEAQAFFATTSVGAALPTVATWGARLIGIAIRAPISLSLFGAQMLVSPLTNRIEQWAKRVGGYRGTAARVFASLVPVAAYNFGSLVTSGEMSRILDLSQSQADSLRELLPEDQAQLALEVRPDTLVALLGERGRDLSVGRLHEIAQAYFQAPFPLQELPDRIATLEADLVRQAIIGREQGWSVQLADVMNVQQSNIYLRGLSQQVMQRLRNQVVSDASTVAATTAAASPDARWLPDLNLQLPVLWMGGWLRYAAFVAGLSIRRV